MTEERVPRFSILTPVHHPPWRALVACLRSVRRQTFDDWELRLVDDGGRDPFVRRVLRSASHRDDRISLLERAENGGIVAASNDALMRARGEFIVLLDHDDVLAPAALAEVDRIIRDRPDTDFVYTDEDYLTPLGRRFNTYRKPAWSPERLRSTMYTSHLSVYRRSLVHAVGNFRPGFDGSQDYDLALRVSERARRIEHVPQVLYHWRQARRSVARRPMAKPYAYEAGMRAVQEHCQRCGIRAVVETGAVAGVHRVRRVLDPELNVEVLVASDRECAVPGLQRTAVALRRVARDGLYDAVRSTAADVVVVLDGVPLDDAWLEPLVGLAREGAVAVPQLVGTDGTLVDGGWVSAKGAWMARHAGVAPGSPSVGEELRITREVEAASPDVVAMHRRDSEAVVAALTAANGKRPFALAGRRIVWTPDATVRVIPRLE